MLTTGDRRITPKLLEVKKVYQYIKMFFSPETGKLSLENRYTSYNLDEFDLFYTIYKNGVSVKTGNQSLPSAAPWQKAEISIPVSEYTADASSEYFLNVEIRLRKPELWADAGYVIASDQFALNTKDNSLKAVNDNKDAHNLKVNVEQNGFIRIVNDRVAVSFDQNNGQMTSLRYGGREMLHRQQGPAFNGYRSINNDPRDHIETRARLDDFSYTPSDDGRSVRVEARFTIESDGNGSVQQTLVYTVHGTGAIDVEARYHTSPDFNLPRLSLQAGLSPALEHVAYYGRGPIENYPDRKNAAYVGLYRTTVSDMREHYTHAQTMGGRCDVRRLSLTDAQGHGLSITARDAFGFSALHYDDRELWRVKYGHDLDHIRRAEVVLNLDYVSSR